MRKIFNYTLIVILAVLLVDQVTKGLLMSLLLPGGVPFAGSAFELIPYPYMVKPVTGFFNIIFTWNPGTSFSLFRALGEAAPYVLIVLTAFVTGGLWFYLAKRVKHPFEKWSFALIIGGALGNLVDRIRYGAVVDFLDFHVNTWHWPAFNFADICICVGVGMLIVSWLFFNRDKKNKKGIM